MPRTKPLAKSIVIFSKEGNLDFRREMCFCFEMRRLGIKCARKGAGHDSKTLPGLGESLGETSSHLPQTLAQPRATHLPTLLWDSSREIKVCRARLIAS